MAHVGIDRQLSDRVDGGPDKLADLRELVDRVRPVSTADQRTLPVLPVLEDLLPEGGLRRGSTVQVGGVGAASLALAVSAGPSRAGSWVAFVGFPEMGWSTAAELGIDLQRVAVVHAPDKSFAAVTAVLIDAFDVVLCGMSSSVSAGEARRLISRVRQKGSVLVLSGGQDFEGATSRRRWPEPTDVSFVVVDAEWSGLGQGDGRLKHRRVTVQVEGRRSLDRQHQVDLWLPGPTGSVESLAPRSTDRPGSGEGSRINDARSDDVVVPFRRAG